MKGGRSVSPKGECPVCSGDVEYAFKCGLVGTVSRDVIDMYLMFGDLDTCLHSCPKNMDVNDCAYWIE